jgi:S-formylglutathione hydrolase FrmB
MNIGKWFLLLVMFSFVGSIESLCAALPCCPEDPEISYYLSPKFSQRFKYQVQYETYYSTVLGKEKGFFVILPEEFHPYSGERYPVLFLLHGYNFNRRGFSWKIQSPEKARKILCDVREEEYHWLVHEKIALIAYAMMDSKNRTYRDLEKSIEERLEEISRVGGIAKEDDIPKEIAQSIVSHNLYPNGNLNDLFHPLRKMMLVLPDGDNGFYTDENEGKALFPETKNHKGCDQFNSDEAYPYSLFPFLSMKPGALGRHESYFLELVRYMDAHPFYGGRILPKRGLGGMSMGGFGAMKLGLKYPHLFQSVSSQSGLLDIELLKDKWMLKMILPEFLEVFGTLEPKKLPSDSKLDLKYIHANNPLSLIKARGVTPSPHWIYFDYGEREGYDWITEGNKKFEKILNEGSHQIPIQPFNGKAGHNSQFWRSRSGNMLQHHSNVFRNMP